MLPAEKTKVVNLTGHQGTKIDEWRIWYSDDAEAIANFYAHRVSDNTPNGRFWGEIERKERANVVHEPLVTDITAMSSNLLFSEPPEIIIPESATEKQQSKIDAFIEENGLYSLLLEAADMCAGMGGVYLKLDTDPDISDSAILTIKTPEMAIPTFKYNRLVEVCFWKKVKSDDKKVFRLFENRFNENDTLHIEYALFEGSDDHIGKKVSVDKLVETQGFEDQQFPNYSGIGVEYIPNVLPNKLHPGSAQGMSDFAGSLTLLDSLDETMTSWMRDLTLGQARIFVDKEVMSPDVPDNLNYPKEQFDRFDPHNRVYQMTDLSNWKLTGGGAKPIDSIQFDIRVDEHMKTATKLIESIVSRSGYAPQSFGLNVDGRADSGTALRLRERKTFLTQSKKAKYWKRALTKLMNSFQEFERVTGLNTIEPVEIKAHPSDSIVHDMSEVSQTVMNLRSAEAISIETSIKMAHPDWSDEAVQAEKNAILAERGAEPIPPEEIDG
jgi:A118 family predicted phage portal protein